ncbi:hypothetical protein D3C83_93080 [compost metagenome]
MIVDHGLGKVANLGIAQAAEDGLRNIDLLHAGLGGLVQEGAVAMGELVGLVPGRRAVGQGRVCRGGRLGRLSGH